MTITKIERQKKQAKRFNIYCDGEFTLGIHEDVLVKSGLHTGDILDKKRIEELESVEEFHLAKDKALRYISYRRRSEKEVHSKMVEKEFHPVVIDAVVAHLKNLNFINDRAFAEAYLHDAQLKKPAGAKFIRQQLLLKGISKIIIDDVLGEKLGRETEISLARQAAAKHVRRSGIIRKKEKREKQQKRLADFLARRGFAWETVFTVVKEFFPRSS